MSDFEKAGAQIAELQQLIAAEPDESTRHWYLEEYALTEEGQTLRQTLLTRLASGLSHIVEIQATPPAAEEAATESSAEENSNGHGPIEEVPEQPKIRSPEEILHKRIEKKYQTSLQRYDAEVGNIADTVKKASKREHQGRLARRQFARDFCDFSDVTGDSHIILKAELLTWAADNLFEDDDLLDEVFAHSANYAERHGKEVTSDPVNLAHMVAGAAEGRPYEQDYDAILRNVFSNRHNRGDFTAIYSNLADSAYELLEDSSALIKMVEIVNSKAYVSPDVHLEILKSVNRAIYTGDYATSIDIAESNAVFTHLTTDITGLNYEFEGLELAVQRLGKAGFDVLVENIRQELGISHDEVQSRSKEELQLFLANTQNWDAVYITRIDGEDEIQFGYKGKENISTNVQKMLLQSSKFRKRMEHLAPYAYSLKAAKELMSGGVHGSLMPLSPSITVDAFIPFEGQAQPTRQQMIKMYASVTDKVKDMYELAARGKQALGISSFEESGELRMVYVQMVEGKINEGILIFRPHISLDNKVHAPLQFLALNHSRATREFPDLTVEALEEDNASLRADITSKQKRFLGRRPVKFVMPEHLRRTGLNAINLRYDPKYAVVKAKFQLHDGDVELDLDRNFSIDMSAAVPGIKYETVKTYYENLVLKLVREWACANEVQTSEGIVSEASGNTANMGHYAYLRIRESDGRRYRHSEDQAKACREEQRLDLAEESARLQALDPTGQGRNSTYVRENYDPNKPPLEVYYSSLG